MKALTLEDAVSSYVEPGSRVYLGNFGAQLFCVGHELIRQRVRDLDAVIASGGLLMDQLLGAGVLRSATYGHCWSPVGPAPAWNFRRAAEADQRTVAMHEMSLGLLTAALTAGAWGVPFMPVPDLPGTGYVDEDWPAGRLAMAQSAFGNARVVRAEVPDVAFVHVDQVDEDGNGVVRGPVGETVAAAQATRRLVLVAEEVRPASDVRKAGITIPGLLVSAYVHQPGGVAPDGTIGRYDRDVTAYLRYSERSSTVQGFEDWLADEVLRTPHDAVSAS